VSARKILHHHEWTPIQFAWKGLSNAMRLYVEARLRFKDLFQIDQEEAIDNLDRAMEFKLEKFHALYDVTQSLAQFDFFGHGDTSLLIVLRNAQHHRDHGLFVSLNAHLGLGEGMKRLAGAAYLLGSTTPEDDELTNYYYYYCLDDFYTRLTHPRVKNSDTIRFLWDNELRFKEIAATAVAERYPKKQVYVDVMPAFITGVSRVSRWLDSIGFQPAGSDGDTYFDHFRALTLPDTLGYKRLRIPA
jgi:hypothetical protein